MVYVNEITRKINAPINPQNRTIHSIDEFHTILKRERYLSDRNNHGFSILTFDNALFSNGNYKNFADLITKRLRITDVVGWYDNKNISILLPDTDFHGAKSLADSIRNDIKSPDHITLYDIYTYPTIEWKSNNGKKNITHFKDILDENVLNRPFINKLPLWKRSIDIFGSSLGLLLLTPLFLFVALLIKIVSPGSVFYKQKRVGLSGKTFDFIKFRTMKTNNDERVHQDYLKQLINGNTNDDKPMEKLKNDNRIIPFGKFLRKACIDELPQLINVFRGEMSLVGPRPCIPYEAEEYLRWHARRFDIVPGMTGLWQISGKNERTFKEMIRLDIEYINRLSFLFDIKILFKTPVVILHDVLGKSIKEPNNKTNRKKEFNKKRKCNFITQFVRMFL